MSLSNLPIIPKSIGTIWPFLSIKILPWCISAWKKPSLTACLKKCWIISDAILLVSIFLFFKVSVSRIETPSTQSRVNTFWPVKFQYICGTLKPKSFFVFSAYSLAAAASNLKSISRLVISLSKKTTSTNFSLFVSFTKDSTIKAKSIRASISSLNIFLIFGLKILIATSFIVPSSLIWALWTCAIEAAATGSLIFIKELKVSSPKSLLIISFAGDKGNGGSLSCKVSNCLDRSSPIISGLVAKNCPSLIKVVPMDCNEFESLFPSSTSKFTLFLLEKDSESIWKKILTINGGLWNLEAMFKASDKANFLPIFNKVNNFFIISSSLNV